VANDGIRGLCLAVADIGITIIRSEGPADTAAWLFRIACRRRDGAVRDRPAYAQKGRSSVVSPAEAALAAAPGVSTVTAKTVLDHFGSLRNLCAADLNDLQSLPGVGRKRAEAIQALIHDPWHAPRSN
jgi:ERCC4-type nuclease